MKKPLIISSFPTQKQLCCDSPFWLYLGWHRYFVKKKKKIPESCFFVFIWTICKESNKRILKILEKGTKLPISASCILWVRVYIGDSSLFMLEFIDWLSSKWVKEIFCLSLSFGWLLVSLYTMCMFLWALF